MKTTSVLVSVLALLVGCSVLPDRSVVAATPSPGPTVEPTVVAASTVSNGDFELAIRSAKARFTTTDVINVVASLTYRGQGESITIRHGVWGPIMFVLSKPPRGINVVPFGGPYACIDLELERNAPYEVPLKNLIDAPSDFSLPAGMWTLRAGAGFNLEPECPPQGRQALDTSIIFEVR